MVELRVEACDGTSMFSNKVYVGHHSLRETVIDLHRFKDHIYGGLYDLRFGEFGPEYGSGALSARLHFHDRGKLLVSIAMQSEYSDFGKKNVASEANLFLISEPALLDNFIQSLRAVSEGHQNDAQLDGIDSPWTWD
ncbi:hypothetical protein [Duganella rivi]|nr:hypothetical protein [Duganella rivi]